MSFLIPFLTLFEPGILWPKLAVAKPTLIATFLGLAVALSRRSDYPRSAAFGHAAFVWLCLYFLMQVLSLHYAGVMGMVDEFSIWSPFLLFVVVSLLLITDPVALKRYIWGMIAGCMFIVAYGIYGLFAWGGFQGRAGAYGRYENHNDYTFVIIQILPFVYMYMRNTEEFFRRAILAISLVACVVGVFLSLSRGGLLALLLEFGLIVLIGMRGKRRFVLLPVLVLVGVGAIGYQWAKRAENNGAGYTVVDAENSRFELWRAARKMVEANPLLGVGSHRFGEYSKYYADLSHDQLGKNAHNTYLDILAGSGFLGFGAFAMMLYRLRKELARSPLYPGPAWLDPTRKAALIALYSIMFRALFDAKSLDWSFYMLCAIGLACGALQRQIDASAVGKPAGAVGEVRGAPLPAR